MATASMATEVKRAMVLGPACVGSAGGTSCRGGGALKGGGEGDSRDPSLAERAP